MLMIDLHNLRVYPGGSVWPESYARVDPEDVCKMTWVLLPLS